MTDGQVEVLGKCVCYHHHLMCVFCNLKKIIFIIGMILPFYCQINDLKEHEP